MNVIKPRLRIMAYAATSSVLMYDAIKVKMSKAHQPQTPISIALMLRESNGPRLVIVSREKR